MSLFTPHIWYNALYGGPDLVSASLIPLRYEPPKTNAPYRPKLGCALREERRTDWIEPTTLQQIAQVYNYLVGP